MPHIRLPFMGVHACMAHAGQGRSVAGDLDVDRLCCHHRPVRADCGERCGLCGYGTRPCLTPANCTPSQRRTCAVCITHPSHTHPLCSLISTYLPPQLASIAHAGWAVAGRVPSCPSSPAPTLIPTLPLPHLRSGCPWPALWPGICWGRRLTWRGSPPASAPTSSPGCGRW